MGLPVESIGQIGACLPEGGFAEIPVFFEVPGLGMAAEKEGGDTQSVFGA